MLDRDSCERRIYRLALLLSGRPDTAGAVVRSVLGDRGGIRAADVARLDRLVILRCRDHRARPLDLPGLDAFAAGVLASLDAQPREAWLLARVFGLPEREAARSMDCSVTAVRLHLERADATIRDRLDEDRRRAMVGGLRTLVAGIDVPADVRAGWVRRRRLRRVRTLVVAAIGLAALAWGAQAIVG